MFKTLMKSADAARKGWRGAYRQWSSFRARSQYSTIGHHDQELQHKYWVSSERGVYLVRNGQISLVVAVPCYGIALASDHFYLTAYFGHYTSVLKGDRVALQEKGRPFHFQEIYGYDTLGSNERIHQGVCDRCHLWAASTGRNTLLQFDVTTDRLLAEYPLFFDAFGKPITYDNHHINSVAVYAELVFFVAYRAGSGSLIGVLHQSDITAFAFKNKGVHDIFIGADNFIFCDTFGSGQPDTGGAPVDRHGIIDAEFFARPPGRVVRGVAGDDNEMLIGHSHKGERRKRFEGHGSLIVVRQRKVVGEIVLPCAQVYQVMRTDGTYLTPPTKPLELDKVTAMFTAALGPVAYRARTEPLPVKKSQSPASFPGPRVESPVTGV